MPCLRVQYVTPLLFVMIQIGCTGTRPEGVASVDDDSFTPVPSTVSRWDPSTATPLSNEKPQAINDEPSYRGDAQLYGCFELGTTDENMYWFCLDVLSASSAEMYFDVNRNGNLTDDGGPIENQGTGLFAAVVSIPFQQLAPETPYRGDFKLWVFTNDRLWSRRKIAHYSRTQLKGTVRLADEDYTAYLIDQGYNDADLSNDGICIDLDHNGRIDFKTENFALDEVVEIHGGEVMFRLDMSQPQPVQVWKNTHDQQTTASSRGQRHEHRGLRDNHACGMEHDTGRRCGRSQSLAAQRATDGQGRCQEHRSQRGQRLRGDR